MPFQTCKVARRKNVEIQQTANQLGTKNKRFIKEVSTTQK